MSVRVCPSAGSRGPSQSSFGERAARSGGCVRGLLRGVHGGLLQSAFLVIFAAFALGLQGQLGPFASLAGASEGPSAEVNWNGIIFRLVLDRAEYLFADPVNIQFMVTNTNTTTFRLEFPSSCQFRYEVYRGDSCVYYPPTGCYAVFTWLTVEPGETFVYHETWSPMAPVGTNPSGEAPFPGDYSLIAYLFGQPTPTLGVEFRVVGLLKDRIAGPLPGDATLTKEGSPFYVPYDVIVPEGITLTIEPGVELLFDYAEGRPVFSWSDRGAGLLVSGTLIARGTPEEKIVFRSSRTPYPTSADWKGIAFADPAKDAVSDPQTGKYVGGCILEHCLIEQAVTPLSISNASPLISNCIIRNNGETKEPPQLEIPRPPLIFGEGSQALFVNNTIVRNFKFISGDLNFVNCIIWHNINFQITGATARHCDIEGGYPGEGNIDADPLFVDLAHGDYHLRPESPCIDAGTADVEGLPDRDMDGDPRISGEGIDIGVDEYTDEDKDGILDSIEMLYFGTLAFGPDDDPDSDTLTIAEELSNGSNPAVSDTDGDGEPDGREVFAGTNPKDPASCFKISHLEPAEFATMVWWDSIPGKNYLVHVSEDMMTWSPLSPELTASSPALLFTDNHDSPPQRRFYKVQVLP